MSIGYPVTKAGLDGKLGTVVVQLREAFDDVEELAVFFAENNDAALTELGYDAADITRGRNSIGALAKLARIARGQDVQATPDDFFFHARKLTGLS